MEHRNIGEELEKALSGDSDPEATISKKILILSFLSMNPCSTATKIANFLKTSERGVMWHIDAMLRENIVGRYEGRKLRFFIRGQVLEGDCQIFALLSDERVVRLLLLMEESPGFSQGELMKESEISRKTLKRLLDEMEKAGMILTVKEGRNQRYYLTEKLSEMKKNYEIRRTNISDTIRDMLKRMVGKHELIIERDGIMHVSIGKHEVVFSEDPFMSVIG